MSRANAGGPQMILAPRRNWHYRAWHRVMCAAVGVCFVAPLWSLARSASGADSTTGSIAQTSATLKWNESFFDLLDLKSAALTRVRVLVEAKDFAGARDALVDHFRQRSVRSGFWPVDTRSDQDPNNIVNHVFSFYGSKKFDAGRPIRWNDTFLDDRELTYALNRHQHLLVLAAAYKQTRDPKFVRAFVEQMSDWIARNPQTNAMAWAAWRNLEVATRLGVWCDVFFQFLPAPEFTPDDQLVMLQSLHGQAAWLAPQVKPGESDWSVLDASGLAAVGVYLPEFKESAEWRREAYAALIGNFDYQVYADGSQLALSPYHHNATLSTFWLPFKMAVENRLVVPEVYRRKLEQMCAYQAYLRRPDGKYPAFNACEPADARPLIIAAAKFFQRPDFFYIVTNGRSGTAPTSTSCAFRESGVFIMRDNWSADANYLAIDAGPYGTSYQNEDKLSLELAAFGQTVIVDPGRYTLDAGDPLTNYLSTTAAHNTLTVDDSGQRRGRFPQSWVPSGNGPNRWISKPEFDYFAGAYVEGYETAPDVQHVRRILFVKSKQRPYWVISDRVVEAQNKGSTATATGIHKLTSRWQFAPGKIGRPDPNGLACVTTFTRGNVAVCPPLEVARSWSIQVLRGSQNPPGGWVSLAYGKVEPAPQLCYEVRASVPATMEYVLAPFHGEARPPAVHIGATSGTVASGDVTSLEIDFGDCRDIVFLAHDLKNTEREVAGCKTRGCFVVVRTAAGGKPEVLIDATL